MRTGEQNLGIQNVLVPIITPGFFSIQFTACIPIIAPFLCTCFPVCFILGFVKEKYQSDMIYETKQIELMTSHKMCHVASFCVIVKS